MSTGLGSQDKRNGSVGVPHSTQSQRISAITRRRIRIPLGFRLFHINIVSSFFVVFNTCVVNAQSHKSALLPSSSSSSSDSASDTSRIIAPPVAGRSAPQTTHHSSLKIALGVVLGLLAVFVCCCGAWVLYRRRRQRKPLRKSGSSGSGQGSMGSGGSSTVEKEKGGYEPQMGGKSSPGGFWNKLRFLQRRNEESIERRPNGYASQNLPYGPSPLPPGAAPPGTYPYPYPNSYGYGYGPPSSYSGPEPQPPLLAGYPYPSPDGTYTYPLNPNLYPGGTYGYAYDPNAPPNRAPNRYIPGYTLSTITERSSPQMGMRTPLSMSGKSIGLGSIGLGTPMSGRSRDLAGAATPVSGTSEVGYWTASEGEHGPGMLAAAGSGQVGRVPVNEMGVKMASAAANSGYGTGGSGEHSRGYGLEKEERPSGRDDKKSKEKKKKKSNSYLGNP